MLSLFFVLAEAAGLISNPIYKIDDINASIFYVDNKNIKFIAVDGEVYRMGTPIYEINNPSMDVPQEAGKIENCSSKNFYCKSMDFLELAIPKLDKDLIFRDDGLTIKFTFDANGGIYSEATCPSTGIKSRCTMRTDGKGPEMTYQYYLDATGTIKYIKIQYWSPDQKPIDVQNLILESKCGLSIK